MKAIFTILATLCLLQFNWLPANAAGGSVSGSIGSKNAIAKVVKVTPSIDNDWIVAVKDPKSPTGYSVKVKDTIYKHFFKTYFVVFMYSRTSPTEKPQRVFSGRICYLFDPKQTYYPSKDYLPRQIMNVILPGRYGSCDIQNTTVPIKASGKVNLDKNWNKNVTLPESSPFELIVNVLSMRQIDNPDTKYFFQVIFAVGGNIKASGNISGNTGGITGGKPTGNPGGNKSGSNTGTPAKPG